MLATIDAQGVTSALVRYDPFGGLRPGSSATPGIGYTGEWTDPTGLVNLRFRAYDPTLGRFISRDTIGGIATLPKSVNRHAYALGNPLRYTDPSGHFVSGLLEAGGGSRLPQLDLMEYLKVHVAAFGVHPNFYLGYAEWASSVARAFRQGAPGANTLLKQIAAIASTQSPLYPFMKGLGKALLPLGFAIDFADSFTEGRAVPAALTHAGITTGSAWVAGSAAVAGCGALGLVTLGAGLVACGVIVIGPALPGMSSVKA